MKIYPLVPVILTIVLVRGILPAQDSDRDSWQEPERILDSLNIHEGMIIGEAGAGSGYLTFFLSKKVGDRGKIFANDIQCHGLDEIEDKCAADNIRNITTVLGEEDDPLFPEKQLDMVIMILAFHDFTKPVAWMKNVISYLKKDARLVIIDRDPDKWGSGWDHFMTKKKLLATMEKTEFKLVRIFTFLKRDNIYIFKPPDHR